MPLPQPFGAYRGKSAQKRPGKSFHAARPGQAGFPPASPLVISAGRFKRTTSLAAGVARMPFLLSQLIETCRWLGALAVLALHTTNLFVNLGDIMSGPHAAPAYVWWFFTAQQCGHQAVVGFFVISGYLVGGAVLENLRKPPGRLREYYVHRICRIYMVLAPALLLTAVFDLSGRRFFANSGVYDWRIFESHFSTGLFFATRVNLQGVLFDYFGTNGPMWSLACEFWYYILFPLLLTPFALLSAKRTFPA